MHSFTFFLFLKSSAALNIKRIVRFLEVFCCFGVFPFFFFVSLSRTFLTMIILGSTCEILSQNLLAVITTIPELNVHGKQLNRTELIGHSYAVTIMPVNFSTG